MYLNVHRYTYINISIYIYIYVDCRIRNIIKHIFVYTGCLLSLVDLSQSIQVSDLNVQPKQNVRKNRQHYARAFLIGYLFLGACVCGSCEIKKFEKHFFSRGELNDVVVVGTIFVGIFMSQHVVY